MSQLKFPLGAGPAATASGREGDDAARLKASATKAGTSTFIAQVIEGCQLRRI